MCCGRLLAQTPIAGVRAEDASVHVDLDATPSAARAARAFVRDHATGLDPDSAYAAVLCVSELVTNGVLHARTRLRVGVTAGSSRLLVTVGDHSPGRPSSPPDDLTRTSGRGLKLVSSLTDEWGVADDGDGGKIVWFTVARTAE